MHCKFSINFGVEQFSINFGVELTMHEVSNYVKRFTFWTTKCVTCFPLEYNIIHLIVQYGNGM